MCVGMLNPICACGDVHNYSESYTGDAQTMQEKLYLKIAREKQYCTCKCCCPTVVTNTQKNSTTANVMFYATGHSIKKKLTINCLYFRHNNTSYFICFCSVNENSSKRSNNRTVVVLN